MTIRRMKQFYTVRLSKSKSYQNYKGLGILSPYLTIKKEGNKMANVYTLNAIVEYLQGNDKVESYKVTRVELLDFNQMEGWNYLVSVSVKTVEGYKNKRIKFITNSTYLEAFEDWDDNSTKEANFMEWLSQMVGV